MAATIHCMRMNHLNLVLQDYDASVAHFQALYGAEFMADIPSSDWHACLVEMGRVIFELFVPNQWLLNARYGAHHVGIEYQADMDEVRAAIAAHDVRIVRDIGLALHTHPEDCFGIAFEFYGGYFHDRDWPLLGGGPIKSASWWRDEHPLGLTGLKHYSIAVEDIAAASRFLRSFLSAEPIYEAERAPAVARAIGLRVADSTMELITPTGDGPLRRHLHRFGDGIRSTVFAVRDLEQARRYFVDHGVTPIPGDAAGSFAIPAEANQGVIFEFAE